MDPFRRPLPTVTRSGAFSVLDTRRPIGGIDYPRNGAELRAILESEGSCRLYFERVRWPNGFVCPGCGRSGEPWRTGTGLVACTSCRRPVILTLGTPFHSAHVPLSRWLELAWKTCASEIAPSASEIRAILGAGDETFARAQLSALRTAMALANRRPLDGSVLLSRSGIEITCGTGPRRWLHKAIVAVAVELDWRGRPIATRLVRLRDGTPREVLRFVRGAIGPDAVITTPKWPGFDALDQGGYRHALGACDASAQKIGSLLELWTAGQDAIADDDLDELVDEFCFRFERRTEPRGRMFYDLVLACTMLERGLCAVRELRASANG